MKVDKKEFTTDLNFEDKNISVKFTSSLTDCEGEFSLDIVIDEVTGVGNLTLKKIYEIKDVILSNPNKELLEYIKEKSATIVDLPSDLDFGWTPQKAKIRKLIKQFNGEQND